MNRRGGRTIGGVSETSLGSIAIDGQVEVSSLNASEAVVTDANKTLTSMAYSSDGTANTLARHDADGALTAAEVATGAITSPSVLFLSSTGDANGVNIEAGADAVSMFKFGSGAPFVLDATTMALTSSILQQNNTEASASAAAIHTTGGILAYKNIRSDGDLRCNKLQANSGALALAPSTGTTALSLSTTGATLTGSLSWSTGKVQDTYDYAEVSTTLTHGGVTSDAVTVVCVRAGRLCNVYFPGVTLANSTGSTINQFINSTTAIPAAFRPIGSITFNGSHTIAGTTQAIRCVLFDTGTFRFQTTALGTISVADGQSAVLAPMCFAVVTP